MKIKVWYHIMDCGDGSAGIKFFRTKDEAEASAAQEVEDCGYGLCDNVSYKVLDTNEFAPPDEEKK